MLGQRAHLKFEHELLHLDNQGRTEDYQEDAHPWWLWKAQVPLRWLEWEAWYRLRYILPQPSHEVCTEYMHELFAVQNTVTLVLS